MPLGFFLGGVALYRGDPGLGIFFLPVRALLLIYGVFQTARAVVKAK